jgi:putative DNA primase/helicase
MERTGLYYEKEREGRIWVSAPFHAVSRERDPHGKGWGLRIEWVDPDRRRHNFLIMDKILLADAGALCGDLANDGLRIAVAQKNLLLTYLNFLSTKKRGILVPNTGWHYVDDQWVFALPHGTIGNVSQPVIVHGAKKSPYSSRGTLQGWQHGVGRLAHGHRLAMFAIATALSGSILRLKSTIGSGGFNTYDKSSTGKTSLLNAAASVWGKGVEGVDGFVEPWHGTATSFESLAALRSGALIPLDELKRARSEDVASATYMFASGTGKRRGDRDAALKEYATWLASLWSTGEMTIVQKIMESGKSYPGQEVRIIDIAADQGDGLGVFNKLSDDFDPGSLADQLKEEAVTNYGVAGPAFVKSLIEYGDDKAVAFIDDMMKRFIEDADLGKMTPQVGRVANRFALTAAAGELAIEFEIVVWERNDVLNAAVHLFKDWVKNRGGSQYPAEIRDAIKRIRQMIASHGDSRFDPVEGKTERPAINRLGWSQGAGADRQWFILPETWVREFCQSANPTEVAKALEAQKMLARDPDGKHLSRAERIQGGRAQRVYVLTSAVLGGEEGDAQ